MAARTVLILGEAKKDLRAINNYLKKNASLEIAKNELMLLKQACQSLSENPERGNIPRELERVRVFEYRQIIHKKYRIIYQISENLVYIFGVLHGRRNISEILRQRLFF